MFKDFDTELPAATTQWLMWASETTVRFWWAIPAVPIGLFLLDQDLAANSSTGRMGWDLFVLKIPVFGMI